MQNMLDTCPLFDDNKIVDRNPIFFRSRHSAAFLLSEETIMQLEQTQDALISLEYDLLLEGAERADAIDYPPHTGDCVQLVDPDGHGVPGCYITQAADVHQ